MDTFIQSFSLGCEWTHTRLHAYCLCISAQVRAQGGAEGEQATAPLPAQEKNTQFFATFSFYNKSLIVCCWLYQYHNEYHYQIQLGGVVPTGSLFR